jgi:hypothetical protein
MHRGHLLEWVESMLSDFRSEIAKMRAQGATQADIELMLDEFEKLYAAGDDAEGKLVVAVLREAAKPPS